MRRPARSICELIACTSAAPLHAPCGPFSKHADCLVLNIMQMLEQSNASAPSSSQAGLQDEADQCFLFGSQCSEALQTLVVEHLENGAVLSRSLLCPY